MKNPNKLERFKRTKDNWCPNYHGGRVRVIYVPLSNGLFRVAVWGNDDCGKELDYKTRAKAIKVWNYLIGQQYVNFDTVEKLGFKNA